MSKKKSIIDEAIAEYKLIEGALNSNSKEILRSVAKEDITDALTESLREDDFDDEYEISDIDSEGGDTDALPVDGMDSEMGGSEMGVPGMEDSEMGGPDLGADVDALPIGDSPEMGGSEELGIDDMGLDSVEGGLDLGAEEGSVDYEMDMTSASDEDVISLYKKLSGEDEIEVVSPSEVIIKDPVSGSEYNVKLGGGGSMLDQGPMDMAGDLGGEEPVDDLGAEMGGEELGPEMGAEPEADIDISGDELGAEAGEEEVGEPAAEPEESEFDAESDETEVPGGDDDSDDDDDELGESVVYEVELSEDGDDITEDTLIGKTANGKPRTATSDVEQLGGSLPTGDIEGQTAEKDKEITGDNLTGGFVEKANGSGDNHADHIMEKDTIDNAATKDVNSKGGTMPTGNIEGQKAPIVLPEGEEDIAESDEITEEVVEEDAVEEQIAVGMAQQFRQEGTGADKLGQPKGAGAKAYANESVKLKEAANKYNKLLAEAIKIKEESDKIKESLVGFRKMLGETAVFNSNLTYVTKLFLEHSTTSSEKKVILNRFDDEVGTIEESKKLYKAIVSELGNKKPMVEAVENRIVSEQSTSQSTQLNETRAYVDPSQSRIMDLINRTKR